MLPVTFITILSLIPLISAFPALDLQTASRFKYPWLNMTLSNLESICRRGEGQKMYSCNLQFDFYDYNTEGVVDVNGAHCNSTWLWDGITPEHGPNNYYPNEYSLCWSKSANAFMFKFLAFRSASKFELYATHLYRDSRFFKPPYDGRKAIVQIKIPEAHPLPPLAPYVPPVNQFEFIATAPISRRTDGLS